jgi:hypothetical protein
MGSDTSSTSHLQGAFGMDLLVLGSNSDQSLSSFVFVTRSFGTGGCVFFFGVELSISLIEYLFDADDYTRSHGTPFLIHGETQQDGASKRASGLLEGRAPCYWGSSLLCKYQDKDGSWEHLDPDDTQRFLRRLVSNESICYGLFFSQYPSYVFF